MTLFAPLHAGLRRFARSESGAVTVEFVMLVPMFLALLFASLEAGFIMTRTVMLERALDLTVRDLRIGAMGAAPDHIDVRRRLCAYSPLSDCERSVMLEMRVIDRVNWTGFNTPATCLDRRTDIEPNLEFRQGGSNEVVTIRACLVFDPLFPSTEWGLRLVPDASGGYQVAAMSAFVNEPR